MTSKLISNSGNFVLRTVEYEENTPISKEVINKIDDIVYKFLEIVLPSKDNCLFVTIIAAEKMALDAEGYDCVGFYQEGTQSLVLCGLPPTTISYEKWMEELEVTTIHELIHYWQEVAGERPTEDNIEDKVAECISRLRA